MHCTVDTYAAWSRPVGSPRLPTFGELAIALGGARELQCFPRHLLHNGCAHSSDYLALDSAPHQVLPRTLMRFAARLTECGRTIRQMGIVGVMSSHQASAKTFKTMTS